MSNQTYGNGPFAYMQYLPIYFCLGLYSLVSRRSISVSLVLAAKYGPAGLVIPHYRSGSMGGSQGMDVDEIKILTIEWHTVVLGLYF